MENENCQNLLKFENEDELKITVIAEHRIDMSDIPTDQLYEVKNENDINSNSDLPTDKIVVRDTLSNSPFGQVDRTTSRRFVHHAHVVKPLRNQR